MSSRTVDLCFSKMILDGGAFTSSIGLFLQSLADFVMGEPFGSPVADRSAAALEDIEKLSALQSRIGWSEFEDSRNCVESLIETWDVLRTNTLTDEVFNVVRWLYVCNHHLWMGSHQFEMVESIENLKEAVAVLNAHIEMKG
jgi:hypothetical protein